MEYVAARMDDLAKVPVQGFGDIKAFVDDLTSHLKSPYLVLAIMGAFLCQ